MTDDDLSGHLLGDEKPVWTGNPIQGILFTSRDWFLIPFSLLWTAFAVFWEIGVTAHGEAPLVMKLFGMAFVLVGLFFVAGRFFLDSILRRRTYYTITNQRILIARAGFFGKFTAIDLRRLPQASLSLRNDGRGTIRFGEQVPMWGRGSGFSSWLPSLDPTPQFIAVEHGQSVFNQIQQATRDHA